MAASLTGYSVTEVLRVERGFWWCRAIRDRDQLPVIIKAPAQQSNSDKEILILRKEFEFARRAESKGVVKTYALEVTDSDVALVMEDFGAIQLDTYLHSSEMDLVTFLKASVQLAKALGHVHRQGLIHNDVQPMNIFIHPKSVETKLTNFGLSFQLTTERGIPTNPDRLEGAIAYMSPERTGRMNRAIDYRTDMYSLGIVFYEMLTGTLPFHSEDSTELVHLQIAKTPLPPHQVNDRIPLSVSRIVMKLIEKAADRRYNSAFGLAADLETCLSQLAKGSSISDFPIGCKDYSEKFHVSQELYGREEEIQTLLDNYHDAIKGNKQLMLVAGQPGIGKSMLVHEVHKLLASDNSYFISGKFDQFKRDIPYHALIQAFQTLVRHLLAESEEKVESWKENLLFELGDNAQVIIDVIPEIELIVGKQPPVIDLGPIERQNRFHFLFRRFVKVCAQPEHPLVVFTDDLQWADSATLKLIELVLSDPQIHCLFWIGSYRDSGVNETHPLTRTYQTLEGSRCKCSTMALAGLEKKHVLALTAATLHADHGLADALAELVHKKTAGNPFFVSEFLKALHQKGLITFDNSSEKWKWNVEDIVGESITDNVVELMTERLSALSPEAKEILQIASCVGNAFDLDILTQVTGKSQLATVRLLNSALREELVIPDAETYENIRIIDFLYEKSSGEQYHFHFRFSHDRIQQAAHAAMDREQRNHVHLMVGRHLLENSTPEERPARIFDIVNHLNSAAELIEDEAQRLELARLNGEAGVRAKSSTAYQAALRYFHLARELLTDHCWEDHEEFTYRLYFDIAETEYLNKNPEQAHAYCETLESHNLSKVQHAKVAIVRMQAFNAQDKLQEGLEVAVQALRRLQVNLPDRPNQLHVILELARTKLQIGSRSIEELLNLPTMENPQVLEAMRIISIAAAPAYQARPNLFPFLVFTMVRLSVKYGNSPIAPYAYSLYGIAMTGVLGNIEAGYNYGKLALDLIERFDAKDLQPKCNGLFNFFLRHWKEPVGDTLKPMLELAHVAQETGDIEYQAYQYYFYCQAKLVLGENLEPLLEEVRQYHKAVIELRQINQAHVFAVLHQTILNLRTPSDSPAELKGEIYDETEMLPYYKDIQLVSPIFFTHLYKAILSYLFGDFVGARVEMDVARKYEEAAMAMTIIPVMIFYDSLICLALCSVEKAGLRPGHLKRVWENQRKMKRWTKFCPVNQRHRYDLVAAEIARVTRRHAKAIRLYERAALEAEQRNFSQDAALAYELAFRHFQGIGSNETARVYFEKALERYEEWGSHAKVAQLRKVEAGIGIRSSEPSHSGAVRSDKDSATLLDLKTVVKASQAISREIFLDKSLVKLMRIVIENAGAQSGMLLSDKEGQLVVEAEARIDDDEPAILQAVPAFGEAEEALVPEPIVKYVQRTRTTVVLDNAADDETFGNIDYVEQRRPKSVLCTPVVHREKIVCILYLENNLTEGAFTRDRLAVLRHLSSQIAISIENARLAASYKRFVPQEFLNLLEKRNIVEVKLGDQVEKRMTVLFADIRGFTSISETLTPGENFSFINQYLGIMGPVIHEHGGFIDKYIGDAIMALFEHAEDAARAAINMLEKLEEFNRIRADSDEPPLRIGIGLNSGKLMLGTVGEKDRMDGTVISDAVNLAARLEGLTKHYGVHVIISGDTFDNLPTSYEKLSRKLDVLRVAGKQNPVDIYEIYDRGANDDGNLKLHAARCLNEALAFRYERRWKEAIDVLGQGLSVCPADQALSYQITVCKRLMDNPPPPDWDGSVSVDK